MADVIDKIDIKKLVDALNEKAINIHHGYEGHNFSQLGDSGRYLAAAIIKEIAQVITDKLLGE